MLTPSFQWHPKTTNRPYQTIQNFAARVAYNKSNKENVHTCLQKLHWQPIKYRTTFKLFTVIYNTLQREAPQCLKEKLKQKEFTRSTRQSTSTGIILDILFNRKKSFADRGFSYAAAKYWNDLTEDIRKAKDIKNSNPCSRHTSFNLLFLQNNKTNINSKLYITM